MVQDSMENTKKYKACQYHANFIYQSPEPLHLTIASWPFDAWELDAIGPLPKSSSGHLYILATTDYFSKWAKAIPHYIITNNGKLFYNRLMTELCEKFGFKQYNSSMYNAPANGLAEAFNKSLGSLLKNVVSKTKRDWHERIGETLWAY